MKNFLSNLCSSSRTDRVRTLAIDAVSLPSFCRVNMLKLVSILVILLTLGVGNAWGTTSVTGTYKLVTSTTGIAAGDTVLLVNKAGAKALTAISTTSTKYGTLADVTVTNNIITLSNADVEELKVETGSSSGSFSFKGTGDITNYLYWTSGNSLNQNATKNAKTSWTLNSYAAANGMTIANCSTTTRIIRFNSDRFACYTTNPGTLVNLYKKVYAVKYDKNGGTGTMTDASSPYNRGTNVTVLSNSYTAPSGKVFDKWNTKADGSGTSYAAGATISSIQTSITLYAQWKSSGTSVTLSKAAATNGSFTLSNNGPLNTATAQTITVTGTPNTGYYLSGVTQSGASSTPTITKTSATTYTIQYPASCTGTSTITATFSPIWYLKGDFNSWDTSDPLTNITSNVATVTKSLSKTTGYEFKVYNAQEDAWYGNNGKIIDDVSGWTFSTSEGNCKVFATVADDYTFKFNISNRQMQIIYPDMTHPNDAYVYLTKWWDCYVHYWYTDGEGDHPLIDWGYDTQLSRYEEICETNYWCVPILDGYPSLIMKDNAGEPSNTTGNQTTNSNGGKYITHNGVSWGWHEFTTYTISYDKGTGTGGSMSSHTDLCPGSSQVLSANSFTKDHYHFTGWVANVNVKIGGSTVTAGTLIADEATIQDIQSNITLTAQWERDSYTITKTLTNVTSSPAIPSSYTYTGSAAGLTYTISANDGYRLPTSITVSGTTYTWNSATGALTLTGTITSNVSITITAVQTHTVDWYVGGSAPANKIGDDGQTTVVDHGGKIEDFPATTPDGSACDKTFVGWTNTSSYVHGTSPLFNDVAGSPTINADASFYAVFATESGGSSTVFSEDFSTCSGTGGNSGGWSGSIANASVPSGISTSWYLSKANAADECLKLGTGSAGGSAETPDIDCGTATSATLTFRAGAWDGSSEGTTLSLSASNCSIDKSSVTLVKGSFTSYTVAITSITDDIAITFYTSSGNQRFFLDDVVVTASTLTYTGHTITCSDCGTSVTPTYTASPTGGTVSVTKSAAAVASGSTVKTCTSVDLTVTITPAYHYTLTGFTATGLSTGTATISPVVAETLPKTTETTFTVTVSAGATGTLNLTPTFTAQTPLSITLETHSKGTFTPIGDVYSGESFIFPVVTPSDAECASFLGWIEGTTFDGDGETMDPSDVTSLPEYHAAGSSSGTLTTTKTYTAVFGEKDTQVIPAYQKVTSAPSNWSGDYLIVRDANSRAFDGSLTTLDAADNYIGVTISEGSITANSTVNASKWTIAKVGATSNYTIKSASGYYIGRTANSNGLNSSTSEAYTNTLSYSDDHVVITSSGGPTLQMNSGTRFRYYTSSQQTLQLYKYNPDAEVVSYTYTTNPACTPRYRVTISSATGGSPEADKTYEHADETITITANPAAGYSFTSWTITKTTGGDNVTSTLLTGDKPTTANTTFTMPAYDITIAATYAKKMVSTLEVKDGATVVSTTTGPVSGTVNISTGANKTLDVVITPSDAYDHSWTATVSAGSTYASITNMTDDGFRVNGLAQGDATITVNAPNDGSAKSVTLTVQVRDIMPEEIILKRDGSNTPIETLIMYYDETNSKGQYVKVNVGYSPANPTNKAFTFSSALTGKVGSHSHAPASGYEVLVANGVTSDAVNCTFTSSADGSVTKVLAVTVLPILSDRFVDYVHGNATQTVSARLSDDRYSIIPDINTPSLSDASDANPTSEDCETSHYHLVGWLPQTTAEALWAAGTPITDATEGLVRAGESVEATGQTWCAIWAEEQ